MTTELWYLLATSILLSMLWAPPIIGQVMNGGFLTQEDYKKLRDIADYPDWVRRANRAHVNLVEQFGAFAGVILVAHLAGVADGLTAACSAIYFWARIVHAIVFIAGITMMMLRTLVFTAAWAALVVFGIHVALSAA
jgi:uncharacterized MAPEG superfamily protein